MTHILGYILTWWISFHLLTSEPIKCSYCQEYAKYQQQAQKVDIKDQVEFIDEFIKNTPYARSNFADWLSQAVQSSEQEVLNDCKKCQDESSCPTLNFSLVLLSLGLLF